MDTLLTDTQPRGMENGTNESDLNRTPLLRQLSPEMIALLERHFWCDFSDIIPDLTWQKPPTHTN